MPGLSNWVCDNEQANIKTNKTVATTVIPETSDLKRNLDDDESPISEDKCLSPPIADSLNKIKITTKDENETKTSLEYILNSPIPDKLNKACIVKVLHKPIIIYTSFTIITTNIFRFTTILIATK